ncbi:hypothetical protein IQ235_08635, partial [Oscillatoriales cyanobacterium LEGE 11467]
MEKHSNVVRTRSFTIFQLLLLGVSLLPKTAMAQQRSKPASTIDPTTVKAAKELISRSVSVCPQPRSKCLLAIDSSGKTRPSLQPSQT